MKQRPSLREQFVVGYMTSHPDNVCYSGSPTPENVAANVAGAIAGYSPGYDPATGAYVFTTDLIESYVRYKRDAEVDAIRLRPHPWEFALYHDA